MYYGLNSSQNQGKMDFQRIDPLIYVVNLFENLKNHLVIDNYLGGYFILVLTHGGLINIIFPLLFQQFLLHF